MLRGEIYAYRPVLERPGQSRARLIVSSHGVNDADHPTVLGLHVLEIWCYGLGYWWLVKFPDTGFVHGEHGMDHLFDAVYFSAMTYSTVGFGDLSPVGAVRLMSGMEAITGLLMITWSATFTYLEMSRLWTPWRE